MDKLEFVKTVNSLRLANKNSWYMFSAVINYKLVEIKGFGT